MSTTAVAWVLDHSTARLAERCVLIALADEAASDGGSCRPGVRRLAQRAQVHTTTAVEAIPKLEKADEIRVLRPKTKGRGHHNRYLVLMGRTFDQAVADLDPGDPDLPDWREMLREAEPSNARECSGTREPTRADPTDPLTQEKKDAVPVDTPSSVVASEGTDHAGTPRERATTLVRAWWESTVPRPMTNYMGAVKIVEKALKAGWSDAQIARALPHSQPLAGWRLEGTLNRHKATDDARLARPTAEHVTYRESAEDPAAFQRRAEAAQEDRP